MGRRRTDHDRDACPSLQRACRGVVRREPGPVHEGVAWNGFWGWSPTPDSGKSAPRRIGDVLPGHVDPVGAVRDVDAGCLTARHLERSQYSTPGLWVYVPGRMPPRYSAASKP